MARLRNHEELATYGDTISARKIMMNDLKKVVEANPLLAKKLHFPNMREQRLKRLINQSLNWQHTFCMNPQSKPQVLTLYEDHVCKLSQTPEPDQSGENSQSATLMENPTPEDLEVFNRACSLFDLVSQVDSPTISSDNPHGTSNEVKDNKLPTTVAWILDVESSPTSLEFHPDLQTLLLVGISNGDIGLWEVNSGEKLFSKNFKLWDIRASTMKLKTALIRDPSVSVNRVIWSPDGCFFAVAFSKHIFHLYSYQNVNIVQPHLEIDAHIGGVNDLAFSTPHKQLLVISCGDDMAVKVWDVKSGSRMYSFESHNAPVFSLCSHIKENVHFLLSNSVDGKIKVWLFENSEAKVDFDGPAQGPSRMIYADSTRIFSSGVGKDGKSFLLEYHEGEGSIIREYQGLSEGSLSPKIFDTTQGRFLAVGDDHAVKIWEMDSVELKTIIDAGGDLPENPFVRFNKEGTLLAVSAKENLIKILATEDYLQSLLKPESSVHLSTVLSDSQNKPETNHNPSATSSEVSGGCSTSTVKPLQPAFVSAAKMCDKPNNSEDHGKVIIESKSGMDFQIERSLWLSLQIPAHETSKEVSRLIYTNTGNGIIALDSNGVHRFWKWTQNNTNAMINVPPSLWKPKKCLKPMTNELTCMIKKLESHTKRVTGLAFSDALNVLVSCGADIQIVVWNAESWQKENHVFMERLHGDMHATDDPQGVWCDCLSQATYSSEGQMVYIILMDGTISIYNAVDLDLCCEITPSTYLPPSTSLFVFPICIAANPKVPNQFAVGFTDGEVRVFEPKHGSWEAIEMDNLDDDFKSILTLS
ncbi:hypothetical protein ACFE04_014199 [Oxalis oulophora]